jgi:hypothetical protein
VRQSDAGTLDGFALFQNFPNPFSARGGSAYGGNPSTVIRFDLPKEERVSLAVYDMRGRRVAALVDGTRSFCQTKKMLLIK